MNCLLFRHARLIDPSNVSKEEVEHARQCPACRAFALKQDAFEAELEATIRVSVDAALPDRIILGRRLRRGYDFRLAALAASVLLVVVAALGVIYSGLETHASLVRHTVQHVQHEHVALQARQVVTDAEVEVALAQSGGVLQKSLGGTVIYLRTCSVPGGQGRHLVLATPLGRVTLITMPNQDIWMSSKETRDGFTTALIPARHGSYALIAQSNDALEGAQEWLRKHIAWKG